jgi:hypothetical protein
MPPILRFTALTLAACLGWAATSAAQLDEAQLVRLRDETLRKPFLAGARWVTDYDEARALARKEQKPIFAYFTRSYAA